MQNPHFVSIPKIKYHVTHTGHFGKNSLKYTYLRKTQDELFEGFKKIDKITAGVTNRTP